MPIQLPPNEMKRLGFTSLDKSKFCVDHEITQSESQNWAMPEAEKYRNLVYNAVVHLEYPEKPVQRFLDCCRQSSVVRSLETGQVKCSFETCGTRLCPHCAKRYRARISERILEALGTVRKNSWRLITLTIASSELRLRDQIAFLKESFRRLRQTAIWDSTQMFGYAVVELSINRETQLWHPHLHILSKGKYIPQKRLSQQWCVASKGSMIVDVRPVKSGRKAARYVSKYMGKAPEIEDMQDAQELMIEYVDALRGTHLLFSFGPKCMVTTKDVPTEIPPAESGWETLGPLTAILKLAATGDGPASHIISRLSSGEKDPKQGTLLPDI